MARGRLITIEGLDGAGKTTLAQALQARLAGLGVAATLLREPGGVELAERIRALVKDPTLDVSDRAEALLFAAARAQLVVQELEPRLAGGGWVLLDRFADSSLAYQGAGRGLGLDAVREVNRMATGDLRPDLTLLLVLDPAEGRARQSGRGMADRMERLPQEFFAAVAAAYERLAQDEPERVRRLDASQPAPVVLDAAIRELEPLLPAP